MIIYIKDFKGEYMLILRDMIESDIEDYVRWFTKETEWINWDAPWEGQFANSREDELKSWTEYYNSVKSMPDHTIRWKYEIEADGRHIGWICSYTDLGYLENEKSIPAIGLDIPVAEDRNKGYGTKAFQMYMDYLRQHGYTSFYTQTWSGNLAMMSVAKKLGFKEVLRKKNLRPVSDKLYDAITYRLDL